MAFLLWGWNGMQAADLNPTPQKIVYNQKNERIEIPQTWRLNGVTADKSRSFATEFIEKRAQAKAAFTITFGVRGDKAVKKVAKLIPAHSEGYYLHIGADGITIAGNDVRGLYYGAKTLETMMRGENSLKACDVTDYPDVSYRGVVEGFYGTPWSHAARLRQLDFYGDNKLNVYLYGPKDDPFHSVPRWREPYPAKEAGQIKELVGKANENGVIFYWAIHPGQDIKWNAEDRSNLIKKFESMYQLGVRAFAVFFDDISGEGTRAEKQADLLNYIDNNFVKVKKDVAPLVMCPTEYNRAWSNDKGGYLRTLGSQLNKTVEIMWTGNSVVHCIDKESMKWINERINRKAYIWWNFPVTDFVRDHLLLGPVYGNGKDIANDVSGFVSNPMERAEASKVALYSVADYTWNMQAYDSLTSWHRSLSALLPAEGKSLEIIARHSQDLGPNGHGFRRDESTDLKATLKRLGNITADANDVEAVRKECRSMEEAADILLADKENTPLIEEIAPWLQQAKLLAEYGQAVLRLYHYSNPEAGKNLSESVADFEQSHAYARALQTQMYELDSKANQNPYQPGVKIGSLYLLPTFNKIFTTLTTQFNHAEGTQLATTAEYNPNSLYCNVPQLSAQPIRTKGKEVSVSPSNEVITWPAGAVMTVMMDDIYTLGGAAFDLGTPNIAGNFKLEAGTGENNWLNIPLVQNGNENAIHTTGDITGMKADKIRLTNISGKEQKVYFKSFRFTKQ